MSDQPFLKCACQNCGGPIEFPAQGVGLGIQCPHCAQKTVLTGPAASAAPPPRASAAPRPLPHAPPPAAAPPVRSGRFPALGVLLLVLGAGALAAGGVWFFKFGPGGKKHDSATVGLETMPQAASSKQDLPQSSDSPPPAAPKGPKSPDDLKAGEVKLEKAKSGSLFYAVGTVRNDSDHQRFGVKVEIEFTDAKGNRAGKATDYTQVIEPRKEWRFRALVLDSKAVAGKVASIKEDN